MTPKQIILLAKNIETNIIHVKKNGELTEVGLGAELNPYLVIQEAIDSVEDAAFDNPYLIKVGVGTWTENITLKPHVYIEGMSGGIFDSFTSETKIIGDISLVAPPAASIVSGLYNLTLPDATKALTVMGVNGSIGATLFIDDCLVLSITNGVDYANIYSNNVYFNNTDSGNISVTNNSFFLLKNGMVELGIDADANSEFLHIASRWDRTLSNIVQEVKGIGLDKIDCVTDSDIAITDSSKGIVLTSPNAGRFRNTINNNGRLVFTNLDTEDVVGEVNPALFIQITDVEIVDSDTPTEMLSDAVSLPDTFWVAGKTVEIELEGILSNIVTDLTLNLSIKIGDVIIGITRDTSFVKLALLQNNSYFNCKVKATCRTTGENGTFQANGILTISDTNISNYGVTHNFGLVRYDEFSVIDVSEFILDTTIESNISCLWAWGTASSGNTITVTNAIIKVSNI